MNFNIHQHTFRISYDKKKKHDWIVKKKHCSEATKSKKCKIKEELAFCILKTA